ncbi:MAG TPA: choice-of-anchor tandem repeat GloVer-containing protein, partial [Terriglobales bacterium]|nr:choice-of-anchor tandem repeat GloVer-containing protein [Terriglobales bacterium]
MKRSLFLAFLLLPLAAGAQTYTFSTLVNFPPTSKHGPQEPTAPLIIDSAGNLYGTSWHGGTHDSCCGGDGTVFKVTPGGVLTVLHNFNAAAGEGAFPFANVVRDSAGNLYGTTMSGGTTGQGTLFKLSPSGVETILHNFTGEINGNEPFNAVTLDG